MRTISKIKRHSDGRVFVCCSGKEPVKENTLMETPSIWRADDGSNEELVLVYIDTSTFQVWERAVRRRIDAGLGMDEDKLRLLEQCLCDLDVYLERAGNGVVLKYKDLSVLEVIEGMSDRTKFWDITATALTLRDHYNSRIVYEARKEAFGEEDNRSGHVSSIGGFQPDKECTGPSTENPPPPPRGMSGESD